MGCDGGRSTVRKLAGFDFPGTEPEIDAHQAMVEMEGSEALGTGWHATATGVYAHGPVPGRVLTVEFGGVPADRDGAITAEELQASIRNVSGTEVVVTGVKTATRFTDNARQATTYRLGRVLLAGDAAHVHSPFGGQGLNLGIGDAANLGWKLAATVLGWAPEGLLDTYTTERHPIGAWVLDWTRAQVALMRPDPRARALREVVTDLTRTVTGTTYFAKKISGVWQRYDLHGRPPAGRRQRTGLRTGRRDQARRPPSRGQGVAAGPVRRTPGPGRRLRRPDKGDHNGRPRRDRPGRTAGTARRIRRLGRRHRRHDTPAPISARWRRPCPPGSAHPPSRPWRRGLRPIRRSLVGRWSRG